MNKILVLLVNIFFIGCAVNPEPLKQDNIADIIQKDKARLYENQEPISGPITLGEVMARALRYNLEYRTERMKSSVLLNQFQLAKYDMLPSLAADAGFVSRNNQSASRSVSIFTGNETLEPSTSQDKDRKTASVSFSWNLLDFGVSYYEAKQNADRYLISDRARKKVMSSILLQAYRAYWNALMAQELQPEVDVALIKARRAINNISSGLEARAYSSPITALKLKRQLLESIYQLETLSDTLLNAKIELRNLINLEPSKPLSLISFNALRTFSFNDFSKESLEFTALSNSSDVIEQVYNARIDRLEIKKAFARLLPGITLNLDAHYDDNSFYHNNDWYDSSLRVSLNLMQLVSAKKVIKNAKYKKVLTEQRRLAVSMAVITQLNIAIQELGIANKELTQTAMLKDIDDKISDITTRQSVQRKSLVEQVQAKVSALQTHMGHMSKRVNVAGAEGTMFFTLGLSPLPKKHEKMSLFELSNSIDYELRQWYKGNFTLANYPDADENTNTNTNTNDKVAE